MPQGTHDESNAPFSEWLSSNYAPPDPELSHMQQVLEAQLKRLSTLNLLIRILPIPKLLDEHTELEESIASYKRVLNPSRRIPAEILHHIFLSCMPKDHFPFLKPTDPPLVFTQVCRSWRAVALNMGELWSSMHIEAKDHSKDQVRFYANRLKSWLARAKQKPMAISFSSMTDFAFKHEAEYQLPRAILDHSTYISELHLKVSEALLEVMLGGEMRYRRDWPLLEKVTVNLGADGHNSSKACWLSEVHNPIWEAPRLKSVIWTGVSADLLRLSLNWGQLEILSLSQAKTRRGRQTSYAYGSRNIRHMLQATRKLTTLQVFTDPIDEILPDDWFGVKVPSNSEIVLRHLTTLALGETLDSTLFSIFNGLQLPALINLTYQISTLANTPFPATDHHPLIRFLRNQHNPVLIETWIVSAPSMSPLGIVECLRCMPYLQRLYVTRSVSKDRYPLEAGEWVVQMGDWVLEALYRDGQASLCPKLQILMLDYAEFSLDGLKAFAEGRLRLSSEDQGAGRRFVPVEAIFVRLLQARPVFVPRAPAVRGSPLTIAQCELEEQLRDLGVETRILFS